MAHERQLTFADGDDLNVRCRCRHGRGGNAGVAGIIKSTPGAIGYVSTFYIRVRTWLVEASVENLAGHFAYPYIQDIEAAAELVTKITPNSSITIVNPAWTAPKKGVKTLTATQKQQQIAYPIATYTYAIVPTQPKQGDLLRKQFAHVAPRSPPPRRRRAIRSRVRSPLPKAVVTADTTTINGL